MQANEHALAASAWVLCDFSAAEIAAHAGVEVTAALDFLARFNNCFETNAPADNTSASSTRRWRLRPGGASAPLRALAESGAPMSIAPYQLPAENAKRDDCSIAESLILSAETTDDPIRRERRLASAGVYLRHHEFTVLAERRLRQREDADRSRALNDLRARLLAVQPAKDGSDQLDGRLLDALQDWTQDPCDALRTLPAASLIDVPYDCDAEPDEGLLSWVLDDPVSRAVRCLPATRAALLAERLSPTRWSKLRQALFGRSVEALDSPGADEQLVSLAILSVVLSAPALAQGLLAAWLLQEVRDGDRTASPPELLLASLSRLSRAAAGDPSSQLAPYSRQAAAVCAFLISRDCSDRAFELLAPGALAIVSPGEAERLTAMLVRRPGMPGAFFRTVAVALFSSAHQDEVKRVIDELAAKQEAQAWFDAMMRSGASRLQEEPDGVRLVPMERVQQVLLRKHAGMAITMDDDGKVAGQVALTMTEYIWHDRKAVPDAQSGSFRQRLKNARLAGVRA